jgi:histidinol-phosphate aminotransferase
MNIAEKLCCPHLLKIEPYQSARRIGGSGEVWLNANELPFSNPDFDSSSEGYNRYPEVPSSILLGSYSDFASFPAEQMLCVRGADEGIELLIRCFCDPGIDSVVITPPTYGMYQVSAAIHNVEVVAVPRKPTFELDMTGLKQQMSSKLVFVCSPNNPTGNVTSQEELVDLLETYSDTSLVVVDEAYIEFCPEFTFSGLIETYPNLVVLRTMSKAFGMAAVRCGFVLASKDIIELLSRIIAPYPLPLPVEEVARQALTVRGISQMHDNVAEIIRLRDRFIDDISNIAGVEKVTPSTANFVLVEFADEQRALDILGRAGIVVRTPYTQGLIFNSQRISMGTAEQMAKVVSALRQYGEGFKG